ncbi:uncharacterized protein LOC121880469 [Homarus americanus]|uniref:uncharacterized protein LOC121880469 n=1 Tax=Homarus americanus TaxID=6706 RepID=UPI001C48A041|nr:uncharacterized protein LOC121880469 [Homarus americanus]
MDASNEFKVYLSNGSSSKGKKNEGEGTGVRQRLVPVINKVFSPSHFMLAQRKTTVYKAISGVSFQDIDVGGKKKTSGKRDKDKKKSEKKDQIYTPGSEGERSLVSSKSDRSVLSGRGDGKKHRHSLGSHSDRPTTFLSENLEKLGFSSSDKKNRLRSASRSRSVSATDNLYLSQVGEVKVEEPPEKPRRSRSASRPRKSAASKIPLPTSGKVNRGNASAIGNPVDGQKQENDQTKDEEKTANDKPEEKKQERGENDCEINDKDAYCRSRGRRKSAKIGEFDHGEGRDKIKTDNRERDNEKDDEDEPEGGYYSLEKAEKGTGEIRFIYEARPATEEYLENDQCVEAIYVCQVFRKALEEEEDDEHTYENYQVIRMTKDGKVITDDDENYENYQVIRRVKEQELQGVPVKVSETTKEDEDLYESINFVGQNPLALTRMTATQARLKRKTKENERPLGSTDSIPFIDDSDNSADEIERRNPACQSSTSPSSITIITITQDENMKFKQNLSHPRTRLPVLRSQDEGITLTVQEAKCDCDPVEDRVDETDTGVSEKPKMSSDAPKRPTRYSYPSASPFVPKLRDKIGLRLSRFSSTSEEGGGGAGGTEARGKGEVKVKKSLSHNDVQIHLKNKGSVQVLSESFSDDDIRQNEDFESFSETDSDLDNLDYELFTPKLGKSGGHRSPTKIKKKPRLRSLSASHVGPLAASTPCRTLTNSPHTPDNHHESPKTFQDLLGDKYLNPPETDGDSQSGGDAIMPEKLTTPLIIKENSDATLRGPGDVVVSAHSIGGNTAQVGDRVILDDTLSFTWSDAESEFEFIDFNKAAPPKTCVVYQEVTVTSSVSGTTPTTATTTTSGSSTTVRTKKKSGSSVKRAQSMKVVGERVTCRGEGTLRWEPLLYVLPEGLTATQRGGLVRSVSGVSFRRSVRVEGNRYTASSADTSDTGVKCPLDDTGKMGYFFGDGTVYIFSRLCILLRCNKNQIGYG